MIVFWIIGALFLVVGLIFCVPRYVMFIKYKGRADGKIIKIETNGKTSRAVFEYCVKGNTYIQNTGWTSNGIFIVGENCNVIYSVKNLEHSYIKKSGQVIQCIVGTLFVIVGTGTFCLGIMLNSIL